jgi:hypothetical protein
MIIFNLNSSKISSNEIGADGAAKLGEGISKLPNLTILNLNF